MSNRVYTLKIAESHIATIIEALGNLPFSRVHPIVTSILMQSRVQKDEEAKSAISGVGGNGGVETIKEAAE